MTLAIGISKPLLSALSAPLLFIYSVCCFADSATELRAQYRALAPSLETSAFGVPLNVKSEDINYRVQSEVYGVLDHEFNSLRVEMKSPADWCELITLHTFIRGCD